MADDMTTEGIIREQALQWAVRLGDPAFDDWDGFTLWLEADPRHAVAYDHIAAAVGEASEDLATATPANENPEEHHDVPAVRSGRRPVWLAGALAASLAAVAAIWVVQGSGRDLYTVETAFGQTEVVTLEPGTHVELAGGTAVQFDRKDERYARLQRGQALFTVKHNPAAPFKVDVADERLVDLGTVFDVRHDDEGLSVAVSEGTVQYDPEGVAVRISRGEILRREANGAAYTLTRIPEEQVGEWRAGRLTFDAASLSEVAAQLRRATGLDYVAAPGSASAVSGSILVGALRDDPATVGPLLGVTVRSEGRRWIIGSR
ncbi:FecR family protein [Novosphingobium panipatense]|uniref:FecR family protein n=1 Tax=Novosphingobium panipatense TaxID=428991 RepID=A0ABY1Q0G0_9SPHN|nr:FecR domain-containing protein [Novosphingobium panipatense]SMP54501.1 FecR family protein [Novosphingobium panipatense]